jgi:hypothetical protein
MRAPSPGTVKSLRAGYPDTPRMAADLFRPFPEETDIDLEAPEDKPPKPTPSPD